MDPFGITQVVRLARDGAWQAPQPRSRRPDDRNRRDRTRQVVAHRLRRLATKVDVPESTPTCTPATAR